MFIFVLNPMNKLIKVYILILTKYILYLMQMTFTIICCFLLTVVVNDYDRLLFLFATKKESAINQF